MVEIKPVIQIGKKLLDYAIFKDCHVINIKWWLINMFQKLVLRFNNMIRRLSIWKNCSSYHGF